MRRSAKRSGFVVPFASNTQKQEVKSPKVLGGGWAEAETCSASVNGRKTADEKVASAEEILKLLTNDSDDSEDEENISKANSPSLTTSTSFAEKVTATHSLLNRKRKLSRGLNDCDSAELAIDSPNGEESLSSEEILRMNASKKEQILPSEAKYYSVVWCKRSMKKHKKWEGDALLIIKGRSAVLKNLEGKEIASAIGYKIKEVCSIEEGSSFYIGGKECEIQHQVKEEDFLSGRCFQNTDIPAVPPVTKSISKKFMSPLGVLAPRNESVKVNRQPIKDPEALYMPEPSPVHQWHHNTHHLPVVDVKVDSFLSKHLRPHQKEGVIFMYECIMGFRNFQGTGTILGDEMGLGKTLQCIALIWMLYKQGPYGGKPVLKKVLIITPSSLVKNWESEFFKWLGKSRIAVFAVSPKRKVSDFLNSNYTVLIISYEMYVRSASTLSPVAFDMVVCDEGHRLKNVNINTSQTIMRVPTKRRILLTGTPIQNDLEEFYAIVEFVNPGILGSISSFRKVYQDPITKSHNPNCSEEEKYLGKSRAVELSSRIGSFFLCRKQDVINKFLPPKFEVVVFCKPASIQGHLYQHLLKSRDLQSCLLMSGSSECGGAVHLQFISSLRKLCNHPKLLYAPLLHAKDQCPEEAESCDNTILEYMRSAFPENYVYSAEQSGKLKVLMSLLFNIFSKTLKEQVVVVSNFTQTLNIIEAECKNHSYTYLRLDGSTNSAARLDLVERFNAPYSKISIFLLSSKAGGVGLNLIGASRIILYDIDWNPATDLQAMARVWRDGQKRPVYIYRLLTTGTIEEKMFQRQVAKQGLSGTVIDSSFAFKSQFSREELRDIFTFHDDVKCLTHDSIQCSCLVGQTSDYLDDDQQNENNRPCQLGYLKNTNKMKNTSMAELFKWNHIPSFSEMNIPNSYLEGCDENITFLFTNSVNFGKA